LYELIDLDLTFLFSLNHCRLEIEIKIRHRVVAHLNIAIYV